VLEKNLFHESEELINPTTWLLAGPRKYLHFKPSEVKAAIVTCGGLCPGLNVVIREIYTSLVNLYGCPEVWGVKFGYMGFYSGEDYWVKLYEKYVRELQYQGGTIFGSSRGGFDADRIINALTEKGINQLYVIGGDGTHRGIAVLSEEMRKRKLEVSIVGIPKTIDNDIPIIDKSFGFETAVAESIRAIRSAYVESIGVDYGIGLVRLMGRDAGFIAMEATNASRDVNICLIPEFLFGNFIVT
jgi:6-phosphofructokinase 1